MGVEGIFPTNYPNLRVFEAQLNALQAFHLPLQLVISENVVYNDGDLLFNMGKGGLWKPFIKWLTHEFPEGIVNKLKQ